MQHMVRYDATMSLCFSKRKGIAGSSAHRDSLMMKSTNAKIPTAKRPNTIGCVHGTLTPPISRGNMRKRAAAPRRRVPAKSIRENQFLEYFASPVVVIGLGGFVFGTTRMQAIMAVRNSGACPKNDLRVQS